MTDRRGNKSAVPPRLPYINRKGYAYHLRAIVTKTGKTRYVFTRTRSKDALGEVPPGHTIVESVNGVVSLARAGHSAIAGEELGVVRAALQRRRRLARHAAEARKNAILVFEPIGALDPGAAKELGIDAATAERYFEEHAQYVPVFRFTLVDPARRVFLAERMCYRSSVDGWLSLNDTGTLRELVRQYLPHLGRDSFYELS